jgi:eukaryotic-like serine/threonine-protein kinase
MRMVRASDHAICECCGATLAVAGAPCDRCLMQRAFELPDSEPLGPGFLDDLPMPGESDVMVGKYTILGTVARGGMGVVYQARQAPLNRLVALKMLLGGAHAREDFRRRFLQEAQAAARLSHPVIVKILDWGEDNGQPFFAMEFIEGADLGTKTRGQPLPSRRAAEIVLALAEAIEYAHGQGVLHRDLKPSNVLLDARGAPRITDFGLAKQLDQEANLTNTGEMLGTPGYLPPEQASSRFGKIGPWSDVYGLGGILYCLLTGRAPFVAGSTTEVLRAVAEQEPPSPRQLNSSVPADLETICLKCLEKDSSRRYSSAQSLADDLQRFLRNEPILARPASRVYKARKWVEKNRFPAVFAAIALLALVGGAAIAWLHAIRAGHARTKAEASEYTALVESAKSLQTAAFLKSLLGGVTPDHARGRDTTLLREILAVAAQRADTVLTNQPAVEAEVREILAATCRQLALTEESLRHAERALDLREKISGAQHPDILIALSEVALASFEKGQTERADNLLRRALDIGERAWKPEDPFRLRTLVHLARVETARGNYSNAAARLATALEMQKRTLGTESLDALQTRRVQAGLMRAQGRFGDAGRLLSAVLDTYKRLLPKDAPEIYQAAAELAAVRVEDNELPGATMLYLSVLEQQQRLLGRDHHHTLRTMSELAVAYSRLGRHADSETLHRQVLDAREHTIGTDHPDTQVTLQNLVALATAQGHTADAEMFQARLKEPTSNGAMTNVTTVFTNSALAYARADQLFREGEFAEAEPYFRKLLQNQLRRNAETNEVALSLSASLARMLSEWAWANRDATNALARAQEAETILRACTAWRESVGSSPKWRLPDTRSRLGFAIVTRAIHEPNLPPEVRAARFAEAEKLLLASSAALDADTTSAITSYRRDAVSRLFRLYEAWPNPGEAAHWKAKLDAARAATNDESKNQ